MAKRFLKCGKCGKTDRTGPGHIGTQVMMVCPDCTQGAVNDHGKPLAGLCRDCCPTGHATRFDPTNWEA